MMAIQSFLRSPLFPWSLALLIGGIGAPTLALHAGKNRRVADAAIGACRTAAFKCSELKQLQASTPRWAIASLDKDASADSQDEALAQSVGRILDQCDLPRSTMVACHPTPAAAEGRPVPNPREPSRTLSMMRQGATVVLNDIALPELGRFIAAWRASDMTWTMTGFDVRPAAGPSGVAATGMNDAALPTRLRVSIQTEHLFIRTASPQRAR